MVALSGVATRSNGLNDLYNQNDDPTTTDNEDPGNIQMIWESLLDKDTDNDSTDRGRPRQGRTC